MAFMLNRNLPYWQQQQAVQANMKAAEDTSRAASDAREAVKGMSVAINRPPSANSTNYIGAIVPYTPPVFDPRLGGLAVESCQKNGGYCGNTEGIAREAIAKATVADRLAYDKSVAAKIAANFERNKPLNQRLKEAAGAAGAAATAVVQAAAAVPDARAERIAGLISNAVASGTQCFSGIREVMTAPVCVAHRAAFFANRAKGMSINEAREAAINPPKPQTPKETGNKVAKALTNNKAALEKVKKSPAKLKAKEKAKKAFAKGIAKIKKQNRRR